MQVQLEAPPEVRSQIHRYIHLLLPFLRMLGVSELLLTSGRSRSIFVPVYLDHPPEEY